MKRIVPGMALAMLCFFAACKKTITIEEKKKSINLTNQQQPLACEVREDAARTAAAASQRTTGSSSSPVVLLLDFNGQDVTNSSWLSPGTISCPAVSTSLLSSQSRDYIISSIAEDFSGFLVKVTKSESEYNTAPANRRMRCVITHNMQEQFGYVGGTSFVSSMSWANNTPCFVFCDVLQYDQKYIAGAVAHELGHTFGLQHQSRYDAACSLIEEYHTGFGYDVLGWAPLMGLSYYQNLVTWHNGPSILGCEEIQNDMAVIAAVAGTRSDDYSASFNNNTATLPSSGNKTGILENALDKDAFLKKETTARRIKVVSNGNSDLALEVYSSNGQLQNVYDDAGGTGVNVVISGKKYVKVRVSSNQPFVPAGDGFGGYVISVGNP